MADRWETATIGRRQFLTAGGRALLALPLLPSLLPASARAATQRPKNFISLANAHGGAWVTDMFPSTTMLTESMTYAGRTIRRGALTATVDAGRASLSPILSAQASALTPQLLGKMNVVSGLDYICSGHGTGMHLGNPFANDGTLGQDPGPYMIPTIDQVMAYSPSFYPDLGGVLRRSLEFGSQQGWGGLSFNWANPATRSGSVIPMTPNNDTMAAFNGVFVAPDQGATLRTPVVDRVYESYRRLMSGNRRISRNDRQRLDEHVTRIAEIQRRASVLVSCGDIPAPTSNAGPLWGQYPGVSGAADATPAFQLINDVIVAALICGTCRIVTLGAMGHAHSLFSDYVGGWHGDIIHHGTQDPASADTQNARSEIKIAYQGFFERAFMDLVAKLDIDNGFGGTILDDTLVMWTQEAGAETHNGWNAPVVTAGSAGGAIRTGSFIDYRNREPGNGAVTNPWGDYRPGLMYNQFLGTVLEAVGVPRSEFEIPVYQPERPAGGGTGGWGWWKFDPAAYVPQKPDHYTATYAVVGESLPYLRA